MQIVERMKAVGAVSIGCALLALAPVARAENEEPSAAAQPAPAPLPPTSTTAKATLSLETAAPPTYAPPPQPPDRPTTTAPPAESLSEQRLLTGFRLGYLFVFDHAKPLDGLGGQSLKERTAMRSPHQFLVGYEAFYRMLGHSWLNVLLVGNVMVGGLEQSKFYPSTNGLLGFEFYNSFQLGVGVNLTPLKGSEAHAIVAAGWTPRAGNFYVPLHAFFVPDVDGAHRMGMTTGVTF